MHGANTRFQLNKAAWLARHLIIYNVNTSGGDATDFSRAATTPGSVDTVLSPFAFDLRKAADTINYEGNTAKAYELCRLEQQVTVNKVTTERDTSSAKPIRAYFLGWQCNATYCGKLGINADFF